MTHTRGIITHPGRRTFTLLVILIFLKRCRYKVTAMIVLVKVGGQEWRRLSVDKDSDAIEY